MRKFLLLVLVVLMPLCVSANSEKEALSAEMMGMMQMDRMMSQMKVQVDRMIGQMNSQFNIPEHANADYKSFQKRVMAKAFEIMDFEGAKDDIQALFAELFTLEELKGIVEFYKSPAGQSMLDKQPQVMQRSFEITQEKMKALIPELQAMSREFSETMKEKYGE
jgi:hypothetical protein